MTQTSTCEAEVAERPGELVRLVAEGLTAQRVSVGLPGRPDDRRLLIGCPHARCTLTVEDDWLVTLEWRPAAGGGTDPKQLADLACALLTGQATEQPRRGGGYDRATVTLKGIVGLELAARGLTVDLEPYEDPVVYDLSAAIVATVPGSILDAQVRVTDDGFLSWECDYSNEAAAISEDSESAALIAARERLAADIVARVTAALSVVQPRPARHRWLGATARGRRAWLWFLLVTSGGWRRG